MLRSVGVDYCFAGMFDADVAAYLDAMCSISDAGTSAAMLMLMVLMLMMLLMMLMLLRLLMLIQTLIEGC